MRHSSSDFRMQRRYLAVESVHQSYTSDVPSDDDPPSTCLPKGRAGRQVTPPPAGHRSAEGFRPARRRVSGGSGRRLLP
uniref:Uncharacterized protein n=1 Tax=Oryza glumipatula TaxID=40148 RepID=A0A0D9ZDW6_9ORYZ